jgi:tripartite-type tricarboxylate transporter receptor subunit TctC
MLKKIRSWTVVVAIATLAGMTHAQDFPNRPVKILVPQTPGRASDALARIMAQKLSEKWGQPVVVENRAGAGGNVGMEVGWFGLFAPAKVPVIRKINADVNEALASRDVMDKFSAQGAESYATDPQQFASVLKADIAKWSQVVKASGASVD